MPIPKPASTVRNPIEVLGDNKTIKAADVITLGWVRAVADGHKDWPDATRLIFDNGHCRLEW